MHVAGISTIKFSARHLFLLSTLDLKFIDYLHFFNLVDFGEKSKVQDQGANEIVSLVFGRLWIFYAMQH